MSSPCGTSDWLWERGLGVGFEGLLLFFEFLLLLAEVEAQGLAELDGTRLEVPQGAFDEEALTLVLVQKVVPEVVLPWDTRVPGRGRQRSRR